MSAAVNPPPRWHQRLADALMGADPALRVRVAQAGLAMLLMAFSVAMLVYAARVAGVPASWVWAWAALSLGGLAGFFAAIRSGWSARLPDPSLTLAQMLYAIGCAAGAYAMAGPMRGGVFPVLMVILMFGMFRLQPRVLAAVAAYAVLVFAAVMAAMAWRQPAVYIAAIELGHFLMLAAMLPTVSLLAARVASLRERNRRQRLDLAQAMARIQDLATHDELTGLINRRHMVELLEQERQRCVRSGRGFCVALVDIDHFKQINERHGHDGGDALLCSFARHALGAIRVADVLARWDGETFVLLLSDARLPLARGGVERLRTRVETATLLDGKPTQRITVSAGLTEHIAGEAVSDTLARADRALYQAKAEGRNRTVAANAGAGAS